LRAEVKFMVIIILDDRKGELPRQFEQAQSPVVGN
jgi:hypothetical protein